MYVATDYAVAKYCDYFMTAYAFAYTTMSIAPRSVVIFKFI